MSQRLLSKKTQAADLTVITPRTSPFPRNSIFKKDINMPQHSFGIGDNNCRIKITKSDGLFPDVKTSINPLPMYKEKGRGSGHNTMRELIMNPFWVRKEMMPEINEDIVTNEMLDKDTHEAFLYLPRIMAKLKLFRDESQANPNITKTIDEYLTNDEFEYFKKLKSEPDRLQRLLHEIVAKNIISATDIQSLTQTITALTQLPAPVLPTAPPVPGAVLPAPILPPAPPAPPVPTTTIQTQTDPITGTPIQTQTDPATGTTIGTQTITTLGITTQLPISIDPTQVTTGTTIETQTAPQPVSIPVTNEQLNHAKGILGRIFDSRLESLTFRQGSDVAIQELQRLLYNNVNLNNAVWETVFSVATYITSKVYFTLTEIYKFNLADALENRLNLLETQSSFRNPKGMLIFSGTSMPSYEKVSSVVSSFGKVIPPSREPKNQYITLKISASRNDGNIQSPPTGRSPAF